MKQMKIFNDYPNIPKYGVKVNLEKNFNDFEQILANNTGLLGWAPFESWEAEGTNNQLSYSTHGLFRYFGKFPPPISRKLILDYTYEGDIVWDPMCGSGTTGIEATLLERECYLNDVNPLSVLISKVKNTYIDKKRMIDSLENIYELYKPLTIEEYNFIPTDIKNPDHWFLESTSDSLRGLKKLINEEKEDDLRDFLLLIFASTVRIVSKATTQQGRLFLDVETAKPDALETFKKRAKLAVERISNLPPLTNTNVHINQMNLMENIPNEFLSTANLIILHPPYFNVYKYSSINTLEMGWLGFQRNEIRKEEVREFFKVGKAENVTKYIEDMALVLRNIKKILKADGKIALMIGDTVIKGEYIPVTKLLLENLNEDFIVEKIILRVPKYSEASWVSSQRRQKDKVGTPLCDFIVILRSY